MTLAVDDLRVFAGNSALLGPVAVAVEPGRPLSILGETGAGKSLLAQAIMGALPPGLSAQGAVRLGGLRLDTLPRREREALWGRRVAMLPQEPWRALDPLMRAEAQVAETHARVAGLPGREARGRARDDLARLGLDAQARSALPGALSGGMAQRVAFAAATAGGARVLLADEPTKGLDAARRDDVVRLLKAFAEGGGTLVTITHDVAVARALGGEALVLRSGAAVERGPAERVLSAPASDYARALVAAAPANWPKAAPAEGGTPVIEADGRAIARAGRVLLDDIGFALGEGGRRALAGPSGLGKTSLLDTLAGLIAPAAGRVVRHGRARAPFAIQKIYQDPPAAFAARVPLAAGLRDLERRHRLPPGRLSGLLDRLGIAPEMLARRPDAVSGGELQRIALARALALAPAVLLADEPTSRLDPVTRRQVMAVLGEAGAQAGTAERLLTPPPHNDESEGRRE
ncbi:MAG: ATP-binding cassette domain-containing protein, partial [Paracoccaceae bacterium]